MKTFVVDEPSALDMPLPGPGGLEVSILSHGDVRTLCHVSVPALSIHTVEESVRQGLVKSLGAMLV